MSVVIETTLGDITVDLFLTERPRACLNFLKLCKTKYYNYNLFHTISRGFIAQTGDPTGSRSGGKSVFGILDGPLKRFFEGENEPRIKHTKMGLISFVGNEERMIGSQFFLTLGEDLTYLDEKHCVFGEVVEGFDILEIINEVICDTDDRPYQDVRITHTVVLDDPYPDPKRLIIPSRSPSPSVERLQGGRIAPDEEVDEMEGRTAEEMAEMQAEREAKARATILEMVGDLPDADMAPPENVLFVCKLNPVTNDDDLEIIFSRFGKIKSCEVIRDKKTGDSLQYAFVEFEDQKACEDAYFKMDNVLIDDRRIHVDFSQSVSKVKWHGKGRGVTHYDEKGNKTRNNNNDIGKGNYKHKKNERDNKSTAQIKDRSRSPKNSKSDRMDRSTRIDFNKSTDRRDIFLPPKNKRGTFSPNRSETRSSRSQKSSKESERSKKNKSLSPKRSRSPSHRRSKDNASSNRDNSYSPKLEQHRSRNYKDYKEKHSDMSKSPRRSSDRRDKEYYNEDRKHVAANSKKTSSDIKRSHTPEKRKIETRRERSVPKQKNKLRTRKRSCSSNETETARGKAKKKRHSSDSSDSDSDSGKKTKVKRYSSDSTSDSSGSDKKKQKLKKRKAVKKIRHKSKYDSSSDSDDHKRKKSKKKKKKRKSESD